MSDRHREDLRGSGPSADPGALTLSGVLLLVGFVVNAIQRMIWHPTGAEDDHEAIFREYAASDAWEATHLAEFVLVLVALAGLLVLCRALRRETPYLALLAAGAIIASGADWAALQAADGITLKQTVDAWVAVLLVVGGLLSLAIGFSIGYEGLESGFQDAVGIALQLVVLVFGVGLLVVSRRAREPGTRAG